MEEFKKEDDFVNMSLSVSPEKYFDARFDGQEKLFTEKFNGLKTQFDERFNSLESKFDQRINGLETKFDGEIKILLEKIESVDKKLNWTSNLTFAILGLALVMVGTLFAKLVLHF